MALSENPVPTAEALAALRSLSDGNMPHVATVTIPSKTGTRQGGALVAPGSTTLLTAEPCRLNPMGSSGALTQDAMQPQGTARWELCFKAGVMLPASAIAVVTGQHPSGAPWTRRVKVLVPLDASGAEVVARFECADASPGDA